MPRRRCWGCYPWALLTTTSTSTRMSTRIGTTTTTIITTRTIQAPQPCRRRARGSRRRLPHPQLSIRFLPLPLRRTFLLLRAHDLTLCTRVRPLRRYRRNGSRGTLGILRNKGPGRGHSIPLPSILLRMVIRGLTNRHVLCLHSRYPLPRRPSTACADIRSTTGSVWPATDVRGGVMGSALALRTATKRRKSIFGVGGVNRGHLRRSSLRGGRWGKSWRRWVGRWR
jgi:hypothetical protein